MKQYLPLLALILFFSALPASGLTLEKKTEMIRRHTRSELMEKGLSEEKTDGLLHRLSERSETLSEEIRALKRLCRMSRESLEKMEKERGSETSKEKYAKAWAVRERKREARKDSVEKRREFRSPRWSEEPGAGNSR